MQCVVKSGQGDSTFGLGEVLVEVSGGGWFECKLGSYYITTTLKTDGFPTQKGNFAKYFPRKWTLRFVNRLCNRKHACICNLEMFVCFV